MTATLIATPDPDDPDSVFARLAADLHTITGGRHNATLHPDARAVVPLSGPGATELGQAIGAHGPPIHLVIPALGTRTDVRGGDS